MPLPPDLVLRRVANEVRDVRQKMPHVTLVEDPIGDFPIHLDVTLRGVPGPEWKEGKVVDRTEHELLVAITPEYPEQKPVVRWRTPIFHPNIMAPADGGYVCTALLDNWSFRSTLVNFFAGVEALLAQPRPEAPYDTDSCTRAAAWFRRHPYRPEGAAPAADDRPRVRPARE